MDAQELCNLQEAYMEVVIGEGKVPWDDSKNPLQSGHTPAEKNRAKRERTGVEDLSKSPTDKQYARYGDMKSVDDEQSSVSKKKDKSTHKFPDFPIRTRKGENQTIGQLRRSRGTPKPGSSDENSNLYQSPIRKDDKRTRGGKTDQWEGPNPKNEEVDIYHIILSHLLDEGYASSPEAADKIILNMSESWFEDIMELNEARAEEKRGLGSTGAQRQRQKKGVVTSSGEVAHPATSYSGGQNPHLRGKKGRTKEQRRQETRRYVDQPGGIYAKPENKQGEGRYAAKQSKKRPDLGSRYD